LRLRALALSVAVENGERDRDWQLPSAYPQAGGAQELEFAGRSSNLSSKHETREQDCESPGNKRAILD
jgi:hypothetical protein